MQPTLSVCSHAHIYLLKSQWKYEAEAVEEPLWSVAEANRKNKVKMYESICFLGQDGYFSVLMQLGQWFTMTF